MASTVSTTGSLIQASGLSSGIDTATLTTQLLQLDRAPAVVIENNRAKQKSHLAALQQMNTLLLSLRDAVDPLKDGSTFAAKTAVSSDDNAVSVKATSAATTGSLTFSVDYLASASQYATASGAVPVGTGAVKFTLGSGDEVSIDVNTASLSGIASAVNAANKGITASVINDGSGQRLLFASTKTGQANAITSLYGDGGLSNVLPGLTALDGGGSPLMTEVTHAQDAQITVGTGLTITSATNTFDNAIPGLTLNVKARSTSVTVTTSQDSNSIDSTIQGMASAFTSAFTYFNSNSKYDAASNTAGQLFSDYEVNGQLNAVSSAMTKTIYTQPSGFRSLADVGVTLASDGTMSVDHTKLDAKIAENPDAVTKLFQAIGNAATQPLDSLTQATNGTMALKTSQIQGTIDDMTARVAAIDDRLVERKAYYQAKFLAMEQIMAKLQSQSNYMAQNFGSSSSSKS